MTQTRKEFLKRIGIISVGVCCGSTLLSLGGCTSVASIPGTRNSNTIVVKKTDLGEHDSVLVNHSSIKAPIFLHKLNEKEYTAVLMICTHKQCELNPAGTILHCPCHGSEFTMEGKVLQGPAEVDLERYKVSIEGETIIIQL